MLELGYWELVLALDILEVLGDDLWMLELGSWEWMLVLALGLLRSVGWCLGDARVWVLGVDAGSSFWFH